MHNYEHDRAMLKLAFNFRVWVPDRILSLRTDFGRLLDCIRKKLKFVYTFLMIFCQIDVDNKSQLKNTLIPLIF